MGMGIGIATIQRPGSSTSGHNAGKPVETVDTFGQPSFTLFHPAGPATSPSGVGSEMNPSTGNLDNNGTVDPPPAAPTIPTAVGATPGISLSNIWSAGLLLVVALIFVGLFHAEK